MSKEKIIKTCIRCNLAFETLDENENVCQSCRKFSKKKTKRKKKPENLSLSEVMKLLKAYNQKHHTLYTYGQFINLLSINRINLEE